MTETSRRNFLVGAGAVAGALLGGFYRLIGSDGRRSRLRPPGALPEAEFLGRCTRCGQCIQACPFDSLRMGSAAAGVGSGTPYVDARRVPCYLCQGYDDLLCTTACPTGALEPVGERAEVVMGTAVIDDGRCLAYNDTICRACWHACPFPNDAIRFDGRLRPVVNSASCVGCGLCEYACPTEPSSIPVAPGESR